MDAERLAFSGTAAAGDGWLRGAQEVKVCGPSLPGMALGNVAGGVRGSSAPSLVSGD